MLATRRPRTHRKAIWTAFAIALAITLSAGGASLLQMKHRATPSPSGILGPLLALSADSGMQGWPEVDWNYWLGVNPDVCAWITVPGTGIDFPVLQAPASSPELYLKHDVHGDYNPWGVPFLDAGCAELGILSSKAAWVYGHNMLDGSMFEPLTAFAEQAFMDEHPKVWIQTPDGIKRSYDVYAAEVLHGSDAVKRIEFDGREDFESWRDTRFSNACASRLDPSGATRVLCLVTCSHNTYQNERTVVYCVASKDARAAADR